MHCTNAVRRQTFKKVQKNGNPFRVINLVRKFYFYLMYSKHAFAYGVKICFRAWGSLEANLITGPNLELNGGEKRGSAGRECSVSHSHVQGQGEMRSPCPRSKLPSAWPSEVAPQQPAFGGGDIWEGAAGFQWLGSCAPQSGEALDALVEECKAQAATGDPSHVIPLYGICCKSPVFTDAAWWVPQKQGSPAAGVGVPSPQLGIVPLPSPGLLCCLIHVACGHPCPFARSCCLLRVTTEFLLRGADGTEVRPLMPSLPGPCRLVLPECSL